MKHIIFNEKTSNIILGILYVLDTFAILKYDRMLFYILTSLVLVIQILKSFFMKNIDYLKRAEENEEKSIRMSKKFYTMGLVLFSMSFLYHILR